MDGFEKNTRVIVIAATNHEDKIDKALLRPGRFDKTVTVHLPDIKGRREILDYYLKSVKVDRDVDSLVLAKGTPGYSGADLENLVNRATIKATLKNY